MEGIGRIGTITIAGKTYTINQKTVSSGDTVYDYRTDLLWQDVEYTTAEADAFAANGNHEKVSKWTEAATYCLDLTLRGYSDWKLPTRTELESILNANNTPTIESAFQNTVSNGFWTSTQINSTSAYRIDFSNATTLSTNKTESQYIRCIRKDSVNPSIIMYLLN